VTEIEFHRRASVIIRAEEMSCTPRNPARVARISVFMYALSFGAVSQCRRPIRRTGPGNDQVYERRSNIGFARGHASDSAYVSLFPRPASREAEPARKHARRTEKH